MRHEGALCQYGFNLHGSEQCLRIANNDLVREALLDLFHHQARWQPSPERLKGARKSHSNNFCLWSNSFGQPDSCPDSSGRKG